MAVANTYLATTSYTPGAATNVALEILAPSTKPLCILRVDITQSGSTTSAATEVGFRTCSTATTGWTSPTAVTAAKLNPSDAASGTTIKSYNAAGTSTDGTIVATLHRYGFNVLAGLTYLPVPEERITVAAAQYFVVKFTVAPPAATQFDINVLFEEVG